MKIVVGLGNPGREYERTPHNVGFRAVDALRETLGGAWKDEPRHKARVARAALGVEPLLLVQPQTFMNLSGESVQSLLRFYKVQPKDLVVLVDDVNLAPGRIRIRPAGSHGGHNGLRSIAELLGTTAWPRVRIGVGMGHHPVSDLAARVLGRIEPEDEKAVDDGIRLAAEAAAAIARHGTEFAMNRYNGPEVAGAAAPSPSKKREEAAAPAAAASGQPAAAESATGATL